MKIAIACDHAGYQLKEKLKAYLLSKDHEVEDVGTFSEESVDYPDFGRKAALLVAEEKVERAILVCGSGTGMAMVANKVKGIRAANCTTIECAVLSREHNDANVLCMGARFVSYETALKITNAWITAEFEGERHIKRVEKIDK